MPNRYEQIHQALADSELADTPEALQKLRFVLDEVTQLLNEQLARAVVDDEMSFAAAGDYAGLTENAVGPRLASTPMLAPYAAGKPRVTAGDIKRARYDRYAGKLLPPAASPEPMRFKPRRTPKPS